MLDFRGLCTKSCVMTGRDGRHARVGASGCALLLPSLPPFCRGRRSSALFH